MDRITILLVLPMARFAFDAAAGEAAAADVVVDVAGTPVAAGGRTTVIF